MKGYTEFKQAYMKNYGESCQEKYMRNRERLKDYLR